VTQIKTESPVRRETAACYRGRNLIVELHPGYLTVREARRQPVSVDYAAVYELGLKMLARAEMGEKKEARKRR
jgi:hypothetical protein